MKYSIITINYNNKEGLRKTIESVIHQTNNDYEFIIIDGASTDGSQDIIREYSHYINHWISEPDHGVYEAMNKGIRKATGEYINFMNSGDCFYQNDVLEAITNKNITTDIIVGRDYHFKESTKKSFATILPPRLSMISFIHSTLPHQSTFFKRSLFKDTLYDESLKNVSDVKFYIQKICVENCSVQYVDLIICRREPDGISKLYNERRLQEHKLIIKEVLPIGAIQDYETLHLLDKSTMYKLMCLLENKKCRKWLTYCIKIINRIYYNRINRLEAQ